MHRMETAKFEAIGQRGEACIIVLRSVTLPNGQTAPTWSLATGERLRPTDVDGQFETLSGNRSFRLRTTTEARPGMHPADPA